jgi:predicted esterase
MSIFQDLQPCRRQERRALPPGNSAAAADGVAGIASPCPIRVALNGNHMSNGTGPFVLRIAIALPVFLSATFALPGCGRSRPAQKPVPRLQFAVPAALPEKLDGKDVKALPAVELLGRANQAMAKADYPRAAVFQYWYVQNSRTGQYNLACFLARTGQIDPAFYWLEQAAIEEGVDPAHAQQDEDLVSLRRDPRWPRVYRYLEDCNRYFESAPPARTVVILPKGHQKTLAIPAILYLHGLGSRPQYFINEGCQKYADELDVAFIGVSGTNPRGPHSFAWSEDIQKDSQRLREALVEVSDRVKVKKGDVITLGFSQGGQVGLEIAVRHPEEYAGAIALSPGMLHPRDGLMPGASLARRGYVLSCGAEEMPSTVRLTAWDADFLRAAKARVIHKVYPAVSAHALPSDFNERLPEWIKFVFEARQQQSEGTR